MKKISKLDHYGNTAIHVLIGLVVVGAIGFTSWRIVKWHDNTTTVPAIISHETASIGSTSSTTPAATPVASGTDNTRLNADLSAVSGSINLESQLSSSANAAINDQQNEIQVPTN